MPPAARKLTMSLAGGLVKHLGLHLYAGAVSALAELIANAWDADATEVDVSIPLDTPIGDNLVVEVRDNGRGMTFDDVNDLYLVLGRDRRQASGDFTASGRRVIGRKGIGKLAGFGIANVVEVWTVRNGPPPNFNKRRDILTTSSPVVWDRVRAASVDVAMIAFRGWLVKRVGVGGLAGRARLGCRLSASAVCGSSARDAPCSLEYGNGKLRGSYSVSAAEQDQFQDAF